METIQNLDLKIQLLSEYLRTGGFERIPDPDLVQDITDIKFDSSGNALPESVSSRVRLFMNIILHSHTQPPVQIGNQFPEYKSFIQKNIFFEQHKIETEEQIDELIEKFKDTKDVLFRGQREAKWMLYSTLQRFWIWDEMNGKGIDYIDFLKSMIELGRKEYKIDVEKNLNEINIDSLNDIAILGYLQHHKCPTPLLDWTYNFKNALFFGVDGIEIYDSVKEIDNYFSIYFIQEEHFEKGSSKVLINEILQKLSDEWKNNIIEKIAKNDDKKIEMEAYFKERSFFSKNRIFGSGLVEYISRIEHIRNIKIDFFSDKNIESGLAYSLINSENIKKQEGVFTWNADSSKPLEVMGDEQNKEDRPEGEFNDYRFCESYNINKGLSDYITEKLLKENIMEATMYPEIEIDAKYVYENTKTKL